jgi:hypothetical protein
VFLAEELSQKCGMGYTKLIVVTAKYALADEELENILSCESESILEAFN